MQASGKIHECFRTFVRQQPSAPAIVSDERAISYSELDKLSDRLAAELLSRNLLPGEAVGVLVERSKDLPVAFISILKAGGVYVPMVADHPAERLCSFARQAEIRFLIVLDGIEPPSAVLEMLVSNGAADSKNAVIQPETLFSDEVFPVSVDGEQTAKSSLAAILFTSGSTGTPKGVMIEHKSCMNMALGHRSAHTIMPGDRILLSTSPGFILGFRELCLPLVSGSSWVPATRDMIDRPEELLGLMSRHRVSIAMFTPSYLRLLNGNIPDGLRCLVTSGERPIAADARAYARHIDYWNVHGATEACGTICMHRVDPDDDGPVPSGIPFRNTAVHLLDENGKEVPRGEIGEIYITGDGVSPGYLKQPALTSRHFLQTPYGRAFRTHDLARMNEHGELETIGRADDVVKVSGQSVSLVEIEKALLQHPGVRRAVALQSKGALFACVESTDSLLTGQTDWREFLGRRLPSYMIPARVEELQNMPIRSSGKLDRSAILKFSEECFKERGGDLPTGADELAVAGIWEELTGISPIRRNDNFYSVGGTSLMAIAVSQRLQEKGYDASVQTVLSFLTVEELAANISGSPESASGPGSLPPDEAYATIDQRRFRIAMEIGMEPSASHIVRLFSIQGSSPDIETWQNRWTQILERHPALRSALQPDAEDAARWKSVGMQPGSPRWKLSVHRCDTREDAVTIVSQKARKAFNLNEAPLVRAGIIEVGTAREPLFWVILHHAVADGESTRIVISDLVALLGGTTLPSARNGLALAGEAERKYLASMRFHKDLDFWDKRLDGLTDADPAIFGQYLGEHATNSIRGSSAGPALTETLDFCHVEALRALARKNGCSLHSLLLALLANETRRRFGVGNLIIGSGISLRPPGAEHCVGHFVNLLPVIIEGDQKAPFSSLLKTVQLSLTETVSHAACPSGIIHDRFRNRHPDTRKSKPSLFDLALTAIPPRNITENSSGNPPQLQTMYGVKEYAPAGLDLSFSHEPCQDGSLVLSVIRNPETCPEGTAADCISALGAWARWIAELPERAEYPLPNLLPHEKTVLNGFENGLSAPLPDQRTDRILESLIDSNPNRIAIIGEDLIETRSELDARANGLAHRLLEMGIGRGSVVAVLASNTPDLPAALFGIWKCGAAYLPLSVDTPAKRLEGICADAGARVLVLLDTHEMPELEAVMAGVIRMQQCLPDDRRPVTKGSTDDTAYIIFTSGTTGTPKGVPVKHGAMANTIMGIIRQIGVKSEDRISLSSSVEFDASLLEMVTGLMAGIPLVPISAELRDDPWMLKRYYRDHGVTIAFHTPSYLRISETTPFEGMRILMTGGEAPNHRDVMLHAGRIAFWNLYGPTETSIVIAGGLLKADHDPKERINAGRPLPNTKISIRRDDGSQVPPGAYGELWLGGAGTAAGYLNRPELDTDCFVTADDGFYYRSGDYGRWSSGGELVIVGRIDQQVKLNGQRIEPGEIEETLCTHPDVAEACIVVETTAVGFKVLHGFIRLKKDSVIPEKELTAFLAERLPVHMRPASITAMDTIPLSPAGKVDRNALLGCLSQKTERYAAETTINDFEQQVARIWSNILGHGDIGPNDNFFALGGNSLLAVTMAHRLSQSIGRKIMARDLFAAPKLSDFARKIGSETAASSRKSIEVHESWASEGEKEFWIAETAGLDTRTFTIPMYYRVIGPLPFDLLQHAWSTLVERHDALKTFFRQDLTGKLARHVDTSGKSSIEYAEMPDRATAVAHIRVRQADSLSMKVAPLWRAGLVRTADSGEQYFWMAIHHSIADGESLGALLKDLTSLLAGSDLPDLQKGCGYFAAREHAYLDSDEATSDAGFWQGLLNDLPAAAFEELPLDTPRSPATPAGNHRLSILLDRQTAEGVRTIARRHESSLHSLMVTLLAMEVNRRTGRSRVLVGTPASLRESASDSRTVAYGINMLPLPVTVGGNLPFGEILRATQSLMAEALQHARYPFNLICRNFWKARPELRDPQRFPMFDLAVTENPFCSGNGEQQRFIRDIVPDTASWYEFTEAMPGQDVVLIHEEQDGNGMFIQLQFNAAVFSKATAGNWAEAIAAWLNWFGEEPAHADEPLPRLLPHELELLKRLETARKVDRPRFRFHELFETVVDRPGQDIRPAISASGISLNYRELEADSNGISWLLQQHGAQRGSVVAVLTGCSPRLPSVVLAIWKAGATYLPLDAALPETRRLFMMKDAGCSLLVSIEPEMSIETPGSKVPTLVLPKIDGMASCTQVRPAVAGSPDDIAYIIYTSGSTGAPKGVLVSHANYINLVLGSSEILGIRPDDRYLMSASPSFDVSLSDIGVPLSSGAAVCPVTEEVVQSRALFLEFLRNEAITVVDTTPAYLALFHDTGLPPTVRLLITGGEAPLPADIKKYAGAIPYFNAYGPTENTITSTIGQLSDREPELMTAGRPLPNTFVLIRDGAGIPVVPGSAGEILLGGTGVASGYLDRPDLTREKFVESPEGRIYRSGDLGRWLPDGSLQVIGRIDGQLKFNGIRIEPGEIEYTLSQHPAVSQAVVLSRCEKNGIKSLWAFVLLSPGRKTDGPPDWNRYLAEHLPSRILPSGVFVVEKMPVTLTGKIDRTLLLNIIEEKRENGSGLTVPADELERMIGEVWSSVFRQRAIHREDNFFALGGHSLLAISVAHKLETLLGRPVPARHLFAEPTLAGFAGKLRENITGEQTALKASDSATVGQQEFWIAERAGFSTGGFNMSLILSVRQEGVTIERWREIWNSIAGRHEALRTSFFEEPSGKLRRLVAGKSKVVLDIFDAANETGALAMIRNRLAEPFSMTSPQLWRAGLARIADGDDFIWLAMHHSISDGLSLAILVDELEALVKNETLEPTVPAFSTIAAAELRYLEGEASATDAAYWKTAFDSLIERDPGAFDEWHLDKPRPNRREASSKMGRYCFHRHIDPLSAERLRSTASRNGSSMHALMLALTGHEVRRRTGRTGFVIGTAASTRQSAVEARTVGYCINMLPLTMPPPGDGTIDASIRSMQQSLAEAFQHARYPFARICSDFRQQHPQMKMHPSRYPLFDIAVTENPSPGSASPSALVPVNAAGTNEGEDGRLQKNAPLQDLVLVHEEQSDGSIRLTWYADAAIYSRDVAKTWIDSIAGWMRFIAGCRSEESIRLPKLLPNEQKLIDTWQYGARLPFPAPSLPALFDKFAKDAPDSPAIVTDRGVRSYRDVSISSRTLSEALVRTGLKKGEAVAVYTSRSAALPETAMGIWKSGGCYVPMSNELPEERLAFMMSDCSARILLVLDGLTLPSALETSADLILRPEELDLSTQSGENGLPYPGPEERGCIFYTSGTTGKPKGVVLHHGGMLNLGLAGAEKLGIRTDDRMMIMAAPSFDLWLSDITVSWSSGAAIVPVTRPDIEDLHEMRSLMARLKVSVATMSPSYLRQFERSAFPGLRILMTVGEPPIPADARHYAESLEYFNGYGPTENSAASTIGRIDGEAELIDVGKPLNNTAVHVLDNEGDPVPPGVCGEIWLSGKGLAEGYLGLPELTVSAFVETDTGRRYRSGDLGRWLPSGTLQILGRSDSQVKLRGQRIELGEIENCLESIPEIRQAVALIQQQDEYSWMLKAAVSLVPGSVPASPAQWTAFLSSRLPSWMIPSAISIISTIPLNESGKVDMHALTAELASHPDDTNALDVPSAKPPLTAAEQRIAEVWTEQLGLSAIGPDDNFFELGGDSLKAIGSVNRLRHEFRCSVNDLYEHPVLSEFALVCHPQPDHVRSIIEKARNTWLEKSSSLPEMERSRNRALENLRRDYKQRNREYALRDMEFRQPYQHILLTGATGYLGSYLLRELLKNPAMQVTLIVRDAGSSARERLDESLVHYFGPEWLETTGRSSRLTVLSGDLRHDRFSLSSREYGLIAESVDAIFHCAANVSHIGHYSDFHADNVETTSHLLNLAARSRPSPMDFHYLSTLSVAGKGKPGELTLFTEYDPAPEEPDTNYYVRTKQEAEALVRASRGKLANACIHRIGNIGFSTHSAVLQKNITENAFFRQLVALIRFGAIPEDLSVAISHVDTVARAVIQLACTHSLANETHHIETPRRIRLIDLIKSSPATRQERIESCGFDVFLERLKTAVDDPLLDDVVNQIVETFGLGEGLTPQSRMMRTEIECGRTVSLLERLGVTWPEMPVTGRDALLEQAFLNSCEESVGK